MAKHIEFELDVPVEGLWPFVCEAGQEAPVPPVLLAGRTWHEGWDIPTRWAIDSNRVVWADNAHGHPLERVDSVPFEEQDRADVRAIFGKKPKRPAWIQAARSHGWKPPSHWDESQWED